MNAKIKLGLQGKIILLVCGVVGLALLVTNWLISRSIEIDIQNGIGRQAISIARMVAQSSVVVEGLSGLRDTAEIQRYANQNMEAANVQFIVVIDMEGFRRSHPDPEKVGEHFVGGDEVAALTGNEYFSVAQGTLGYSLRAFTPVIGPEGNQVGVVAVGILMNYVQQAVGQARRILVLSTILGLLVGVIGAVLLAGNIKRTLFGLEPEIIAKRLQERSAMLQSVREGIIAVNRNGILTLMNEEAKRLLGLAGIQDDPIGRPVNDYVPNTRMLEVIESGKAELDQEQDFYGVAVFTNRLPVVVDGKIVGAIATFRDKTEVKRLAEELTGVRDYVEALRAQSHEFMNQLHVILGLVQLESYDLLPSYINRIASDHQAEVSFVGKRIRDPVLAGFILSKLSLAREQDVRMQLSTQSYVPEPQDEETAHELVTIIGNLVENAFDAVRNMPYKEVELYVYCQSGLLYMEVSDTGEGVPEQLGEKIFEKGVSSKADNRGFGLYLVHRSLERLHGSICFAARPEGGTLFKAQIPYEDKGELHD